MRVPARGAAQRGQSMTEFLVALAALLPLFLVVSYAGRYGDLLQASVQASRYAAFQRALQPDAGRLTDDKLRDQMRARFFVRGNYSHDGHLQSDDTAVGLGDKGTPALWRDLGGKALLASPDSATLSFAGAALNSGVAGASLKTMAKSANKTYGDARVAQVEVGLVNKLDLSDAPKPLITLGAATAVAGDGLGSGGSKPTRDSAAAGVFSTYIPGVIETALDMVIWLLEPNQPDLGCIKPDAVPHGRLDPFSGVEGCE